MSRIKFVGGQEDGNYFDVEDFLDFVHVLENVDPEVRAYVGCSRINNVIANKLTYVRRGDVMVYDEPMDMGERYEQRTC